MKHLFVRSFLLASALAILALPLATCVPAHAQDAPAASTNSTGAVAPTSDVSGPHISQGVTDAIASFLTPLVAKYTWLATIISVLGIARLILKPLFTFLHTVVQTTPTTKDDDLLTRTENSTAFKWVVFILDYVFSIKLIHPKTTS